MKYRIKKFINILRARYNAIKIGGIKRLFKSDRKNRKFLSRRKQKQKYGAGFLTRRTYIKTELAKRDGRCCYSCLTKMKLKTLTIDHIIPISEGGGNEKENLRLLCRECHELKNRGYVPLQ